MVRGWHSGRCRARQSPVTRWIVCRRRLAARRANVDRRYPVDLFDLTGKVAVVTGGTRGIGLMMARGLLQAGARVYVSSRKAEAGDAAVAELSAFGKVVSIPADLSREEECRRLAADGRRARGRAAHPGQQRRRHVGRAVWRPSPSRRGTRCSTSTSSRRSSSPARSCRCSRRPAPHDDPARVVNVGSIDGLHVPPMHTYSYSSSKAALHHLTRVLAKELGPRHDHGQRRRAGAVRVEDDGRHPRRVRQGDRRPRRRWAGSAAPTTWPASSSTWPAGPAPT